MFLILHLSWEPVWRKFLEHQLPDLDAVGMQWAQRMVKHHRHAVRTGRHYNRAKCREEEIPFFHPYDGGLKALTRYAISKGSLHAVSHRSTIFVKFTGPLLST
eukprot:scaffold100784_cov53-Prasinocladus_malaysianus.AAC.1